MKLTFSTLLFVTPALLVLGCTKESKPAPQAPTIAKAQLVKSVDQQGNQLIWMTGTVRAKESAIISAQIPARIRQVRVQAGDRVRAGQLLVILDDEAMRSALNRASAAGLAVEKQQLAGQSDASLAASTLARYQMLKDQKSVSPQEFDEVQKKSEAAQLRVQSLAAQSDEAKAEVAGTRTQLSYTQLRAPFSGIVTARSADPGTLASPGIPLLQIDHDGPLQLYTMVDESMISTVQQGMKVAVKIDGMVPSDLTGTVAQIVPEADAASRGFEVKLDLPATKGLHAGIYATAAFQGGTRAMITAPGTAIVVRGSLACVYALDQQGIAQLRYVTLGSQHGDQVEVLSGITGGETLINNPGDRDLAGRRIEDQR
jgi:RND family efflux transporter MFP subunit